MLDRDEDIYVEPGACPYGPTADLALLLPDHVKVTPGMRSGDVVDDGQFFFGEPEIIFCPIEAADESVDNAEIDEFRVDVAFGRVDVTDYLDQNFETVAAEDLIDRPAVLGGDVDAVCHFDGCTAAWQLDDLFMAVTLIDGKERSATLDNVAAALEAIVPVVVARLTALGTQRAELNALAQSYWSDVFDDAAWTIWRMILVGGRTEAYPLWIADEVAKGTITTAEGEELVKRLDELPGDEYFPD